MKKTLFIWLLAALMLLGVAMAEPAGEEILVDGEAAMTDEYLVEYGYDYYTPDEVALYLHVFEELPPNYITKDEAEDMGWDSRAGNLWEAAYGLCIGGDRFGNREGLLPAAKGRQWYECDVNYEGGYRGAERLLFSNDGMIFYSDDHYLSYTELYDDWYDDQGWYVGDTNGGY